MTDRSASRSSALAIYLALSRLLAPVAPLILRHRLARGKEDACRLAERLGYPGTARPEGRLAWLHGASVGEAMSLVPLVEALLRADAGLRLLVTSGTVTSAHRLADMLPEGVIHHYAPVDTAPAVHRFLDHWRPDLALRVESEFWPRLLWETARRGIPMALVNARMSAKSATRWQRLPAMASRLVTLFDLVSTQDQETRARLIALGAPEARVEVGGNLKTLLPPPGCDAAELARLRTLSRGRPVWLAASTHDPEEELALVAHRALRRDRPGALLILAPRHPDRGDALAAWLRAEDVATARRSAGEVPGPGHAVWLADTLGEMGLWYRLAQVSFVGGSIAPMGGHNPFEPAELGSAILHGVRVENFAPAYRALAAANGSRDVTDAHSLAAALLDLSEPDGTQSAAARALTEAASRALSTARPDADALARRLLDMIGSAG